MNGKHVSKRLATRPEAQRWIRRALSDAEPGILPSGGGRSTVAKLLESWLDA